MNASLLIINVYWGYGSIDWLTIWSRTEIASLFREVLLLVEFSSFQPTFTRDHKSSY